MLEILYINYLKLKLMLFYSFLNMYSEIIRIISLVYPPVFIKFYREFKKCL